jgi:hypothetical protein
VNTKSSGETNDSRAAPLSFDVLSEVRFSAETHRKSGHSQQAATGQGADTLRRSLQLTVGTAEQAAMRGRRASATVGGEEAPVGPTTTVVRPVALDGGSS